VTLAQTAFFMHPVQISPYQFAIPRFLIDKSMCLIGSWLRIDEPMTSATSVNAKPIELDKKDILIMDKLVTSVGKLDDIHQQLMQEVASMTDN
jgi:hypothetical protein